MKENFLHLIRQRWVVRHDISPWVKIWLKTENFPDRLRHRHRHRHRNKHRNKHRHRHRNGYRNRHRHRHRNRHRYLGGWRPDTDTGGLDPIIGASRLGDSFFFGNFTTGNKTLIGRRPVL